VTPAERRQRVETLIGAAARVDTPALRERLAHVTGLHPRGVGLALEEHLETSASDEEIGALLGRAGQAPRVQVVLSANVFTAGLRALCLAAAAAPVVQVRCSRREDVFVPALLAEAGLDIGLVEEIAPAAGDEVHLYGSDGAIRSICGRLPEGVRVRAHGTGMGVALVGGGGGDEQARAVARDIVVFDQQGCLSPRLALVRGQGRAFAQAVARHLEQLAEQVPAGQLDAAGQARFRDTASVAGECFDAGPGWVALLQRPWVPPAGRNLVVVEYDLTAAPLEPLARHVAALGVHDPDGVFGPILRQCPGARVSALGRMQKPLLDGPVDLRHPGWETPAQVVARLR
jgi:hypothetical protein